MSLGYNVKCGLYYIHTKSLTVKTVRLTLTYTVWEGLCRAE